MDEENIPMEDSCDIEYACGDPKVDIRVGDEYQAEIPLMMSESERAALLSNPLALDCRSDSSVMGLPVDVMWIDRDRPGLEDDDNVNMNEVLKSLKAKRSRKGESDGKPGTKKRMNLEAVPEISSSSWEDLEVDGFVLGLYTFGKNFTQVKKLLEGKETGELLSFYYGKFYKSAKHKIWSNALKKRSRRCIQGKKLYSGWRLQLLLTRLIPSIPDESQKQTLVDVSKSFAEGNTSLENYISAVKELVGLRSLVEAVAIGKDREGLTVLTTEPVKAKKWLTVSSAVPAGLEVYNSLTSDDIIKQLTGGSRLSKARCNDIFWEAVWPRLLARGWHSEQPKDQGYIKSKEHIVFLVPGVKKFSRRKLVKKNHYFDSVSDILTKVVSEPELIEFETAEVRGPNGFIDASIRDQSNQEKHCYLRAPDASFTDMKFTVVDTTSLASGGELCKLRELKNPNPESLVSQRGDKDSSVWTSQIMPLDVQKRVKFGDECKWEKRQMKKLVEDPMRFMIVDTSLDHGGLRKRRHFPGDENACKIRKCLPREAFGDSTHNQSGTSTGAKVENAEQGRSKKRIAWKSESDNHHSVNSLTLPKRRLLSTCVKKDIKRSGESSVSNLKTNQSEETGNGMSLQVEIQETPKTEPNGLCPISETVHGLSSSAQQQEPNGFCSSKEKGALHELRSSEQMQQSEKNCSTKNLDTAQEQEKQIQLPSKSGSDKKSTSIDQGTTQELASLEQKKEESNQQINTDNPRRQSTRKRPLTTRALEAIESGLYTAKSMISTSKPRKRERSTRIKKSAKASNRGQGESDNGKEDTTSKQLEQIEDSEPSFLVSKATTASKPVDQIEDSKKVTNEFPKLPPILLKLPFKRG